MFTYNPSIHIGYQPIHRPVDGSVAVKQNQSVTPAQIAELTSKGMAVSNYNNLVFDEGLPNPPSLPLEQHRGVDVVDVWNASQTASKKLRSVMKSASSESSN